MAAITLLGELLTVIGPVGVFGLWLFQQTEVEAASGELRNIAAARAVYQTYQSHNATFNAISEVVGDKQSEMDRLRNYQVYNYELGLAAIENALSPAERSGIPPRTDAFGGTQSFQDKMTQTQKRLELLQTRLNEKEAVVKRASIATQTRYFWIFVALSCLSILGAVGKTAQKLSSTG